MQENTGVRLSSTVPNKVVLSLVLVYWYTSLAEVGLLSSGSVIGLAGSAGSALAGQAGPICHH